LLPSSARTLAAALDLIATALRLPSVFNFDALFKMDAVIGCKDHPLFSLLRVFLNEGLLEFQSWNAEHSDILPEYSALSILMPCLHLTHRTQSWS
jgi:translation initiation factor 3 subunit M